MSSAPLTSTSKSQLLARATISEKDQNLADKIFHNRRRNYNEMGRRGRVTT